MFRRSAMSIAFQCVLCRVRESPLLFQNFGHELQDPDQHDCGIWSFLLFVECANFDERFFHDAFDQIWVFLDEPQSDEFDTDFQP